MRIRSTALASSVALVSLLALSCATSGVNSGDFNLISLDEEWQLGAQLERDLSKQVKLVGTAGRSTISNRVGHAIVDQTELRDREWTFHLVDDPAVNAFNVPGGHVYVNTGLVEAAPDAAAFAGVLAHEIGHGVARHGTERLTKVYGINILGGVLLGQNPKAYEQILAQILAGGAVARFSRADEREADELGVRYSYEAGYDPMGLPRMLEVLAREASATPARSSGSSRPTRWPRIESQPPSRWRPASKADAQRPGVEEFQRVAARAN